MSFSGSLNPDRGGQHACVYGCARTTHPDLNLGAGEDVSRILCVRPILVERLRAEIGKKTWVRNEVAAGSATDPYQPIEGHWRLTRESLLALAEYKTPGSIIANGTLIQRGLDVLEERHRVTRSLFSSACPPLIGRSGGGPSLAFRLPKGAG